MQPVLKTSRIQIDVKDLAKTRPQVRTMQGSSAVDGDDGSD
jgi:hypothetical protein